MIVTCASCLTKFNLDDSRISPKGIKVRCSRCKHVFYVVAPPETKEEVMEDFESFAKYHEDLMVPGEEPRKGLKVEEKEPPPSQKTEEETVPEPIHQESAAPEKEEESFPFKERAPKKPEEREEEALPEREKVEIEPSRPGESPRRGKKSPSPFLAVIIVLLVLVFGLFYVWTELKSGGKLSPYLSIPVQKVQGFWNNLWGTEKEGLEVGDLTGYDEKVGDLPLFVIGGKVSNQSRFTKRQIKVKVVIFDQDKIKMAEKEAVCGRVLSREELRSQPPSFFKGEMVIKPQTEKEMVVPSGKAAPFMVVLRDPLNQAKEFKVEIVEAPNL